LLFKTLISSNVAVKSQRGQKRITDGTQKTFVTGRIARLIELDPLYVDVAVRRWERITGVPAQHATSGLNFEQVAAERGASTEPGDSFE